MKKINANMCMEFILVSLFLHVLRCGACVLCVKNFYKNLFLRNSMNKCVGIFTVIKVTIVQGKRKLIKLQIYSQIGFLL